MDQMELLTRLEPLREDLKPYLTEGPLGPMFHHPFMVELVCDVNRAARINSYVGVVERETQEALKNKKWGRYVFRHERPYRVEALLRVVDQLPDEEYWPLVGEVWVDSENIWQNLDKWVGLLSSVRPQRHLMMTEEERAALGALPDRLTIYRGCTPQNRRGLSWTLDRDKALWFAKRFRQDGSVVTQRVFKRQVVAHFTGRGESEVVVVKV